MKTKVKWRVGAEPTGRYRSFENRMWPGAEYCDKEQNPAAQIYCKDENEDVISYSPQKAREGNHPPLTLHVADHSHKPHWIWRKAKGTFATIAEAKNAFAKILEKFPHIAPHENNQKRIDQNGASPA